MTKSTRKISVDSELTAFEYAVLEKLLFGDDPVLQTLKIQFECVSVCDRELTGAGFFLYLSVSDEAPRIIDSKVSFNFGDVFADIEDLKYGAGFVLFVKDGVLDMLEGYSYDEPWPDTPKLNSLSYDGKPYRAINLIRTAWTAG